VDLRTFPPSRASLVEHTARAIYQSSYVWEEGMTDDLDVPAPDLWGWLAVNGGFKPKWATPVINIDNVVATCACRAGKSLTCKCLNFCGCKGLCK